MSKDIININVVQKTINKEKKRFVNARELHKWLKSKRKFADWIKDRIEKYDFVENIDYFAVHNFVNGTKIRADGLLIDAKMFISQKIKQYTKLIQYSHQKQEQRNMKSKIINNDCLIALKEMEDNSIVILLWK